MIIYTVGHSTRSTEELISILRSFNVELLVDVRSYPGSRRCPWFGKEQLRQSIEVAGLSYIHIPTIGGRRYEKDPEEQHAGWNEAGFRNYAAYAAKSSEFQIGLQQLMDLANQQTVAIMCSEAVWWRCHRRIITDYLINAGCEVHHIMNESHSMLATMTTFAQPNGKIILYPKS